MKRKFEIGIKLRLFLEVGAIIAAALIGLSVVNSQMLERVYMWREERTLASMAENVERADGGYFQRCSEYETNDNVSIDLYDESDNYLYEGSGSFVSGSKFNVVSRTDNPDGSYFNVVSAEGSTLQYILYGKDFANGWHIEIMAKKNPIEENARLGTVVTTVISVLALGVVLLFIFLYAKRFTKPLIEMSDVTTAMANLNFDRKCTVNRRDEIGALAQNINTLSDSLDSALGELKEKNAALLEDIEKERRLEKMRRDFVSGASHELKTPISIIRGYAEALKMDLGAESEETAKYCDIIMNEADRMNSLVLSMLEQSRYEAGGKPPQKECFAVDGLVEEFLSAAGPILKEHGLTAHYEKTNGAEGYADRAQMTTVLSNYVSNACCHAAPVNGEKSLRISVTDCGARWRVNVWNSGSRIEEKDKDAIFTSFYRADKSRSRAEGRFGLGLAIVRSIADNHGTACGFDNTDDGVTFWFEMEKAPQEEPQQV